MSKVTDAVERLKDNPNAQQILDSILTKGTLTVGNQNDYINCLNKCWPNASSDQANELAENLNNQPEGTVLSYILSDEPDEDCVLSMQVGEKLYLIFYYS